MLRIYSSTVSNKLKALGFICLKTEINQEDNRYLVYYFKATKESRAALKEIYSSLSAKALGFTKRFDKELKGE